MGLPKEIAKFMADYKVDADEIWKIPQGTAYAVKHKALERVAAEQGVEFGPPIWLTCNPEAKIVVVQVTGKLKDRSEWSTGEAAPYNSKNNYPVAMAEKRAKDRVILKLLNTHGALYSEDEAEEFRQRDNPHVTRPADIVPEVQYDDNGNPVDNIPKGDDRIERMPKARARSDFAAAQNEMHATKTPRELETWGKANANRVETYPTDWQEILRGLYTEHMDALRNKEAA